MEIGAAGEIGFGLGLQPIGQAAPAMPLAPEHKYAGKPAYLLNSNCSISARILARRAGVPLFDGHYGVRLLDPYDALIADLADKGNLMRDTAKRDNSAILKRNRLRQAVDLTLEPLHVASKEIAGVLASAFAAAA